LILIIALLAGFFPAFVLSKYRPTETLTNRHLSGNKGKLLQNSLITAQLIVSISLIICTLTVRKQLQYVMDKDLGYKKDRLVVIETHKRTKEGFTICERLETELENSFKKTDFTTSYFTFVNTQWFELGFTTKEKIYKGFQYNSVDAEFIPAMGLKVLAGRNFAEGNLNDKNNAAIVNESFVKNFNLKDPIGKKVPGPFHHTIIGVVKDFNYMSLHNPVDPLMLTINPDSVLNVTENISYQGAPNPRVTVRLGAGSLSAGIDKLEAAWKEVLPGQQFDFKFVDDGLMAQYENEKRVGTVSTIMAALSIVIACLGLFGLATLNVTRRTKEIGIRKVLGASQGIIVWLLSGNIIQLVLIAAVITGPITWYFLENGCRILHSI
jgi:putative ABC transport system permease protein